MWLHYDVISTQRRHHSSKASILFMQKNREELSQKSRSLSTNTYVLYKQMTQHLTYIFIVCSWSSNKTIKVCSAGVTDCSVADCSIELRYSISHMHNVHITHGRILTINVKFCNNVTVWWKINWTTKNKHWSVQNLSHCAYITFQLQLLQAASRKRTTGGPDFQCSII